MAAEIIDLALVKNSRRCLKKLLAARGIAYFLDRDATRPFRLDSTRVELVLRTAVRLGGRERVPTAQDLTRCRQEIRRELIERVANLMLQTGL
jgi:hypothetical protein